MNAQPQGRSNVAPSTYVVKARPHFFGMMPRYELHIINQETGQLVFAQTVTLTAAQPALTYADLIDNFLHAHGFYRTNKFSRDELPTANIAIMPTPAARSEVERLGVI